MSNRGKIIRGAGGLLKRNTDLGVGIGHPYGGEEGEIRVQMVDGSPKLYARAGATWYGISLKDESVEELKIGDSTNYIELDPNVGINIINSSVDVASIGETLRIGPDSTSKSALRVTSDGAISIGVKNAATPEFQVTAAGELILAGAVVEATTTTAGTLIVDTNTLVANVDGHADRVGIGTATPESTLEVLFDSNTAWGNDSVLGNYQLFLKNLSTTTNAWAGIAFDISSETDEDSIGAAIVALRDTSASTTAAKHDSNLVFATNDADDADDQLAERMRITHDGNVGIGDTTPQALLSLRGDATDTNQPTAFNGSNADTHTALHINNIGNVVSEKYGMQFGFADGYSIGGIFGTGNSTSGNTNGNITFDMRKDISHTALTEVMRIQYNGNVGIGVTDPDNLLEIAGTSADVTLVINALTAANDAELKFRTGDSSDWVIKVDGSETNDPLIFYDYSSTSTVMCLNNGNVGIGDTSPQALLSIKGDPTNSNQPSGLQTGTDTHTALHISSTSGDDASTIDEKYGIQFGCVSNYSFGGMFGVGTSLGGNTLGAITFDMRASTGATALTEVMRIQNNGCVGIGTTTPAASLHIASTPVVPYSYLYLERTDDDDGTIDGEIIGGVAFVNSSAVGNDPDVCAVIQAKAGSNFGTDDDQKPTDLQFFTQDESTSSTLGSPRMTIDMNGKVGIGVSGPNHTLSIVDDGDIGSQSFTAGFGGNGWQIEDTTTATATFDDLTVRGTMSIYELLIQQIRATNGSIMVTSTGKVKEIGGGLSPSDDAGTIIFEDPTDPDASSPSVCPFAVNDIILCQQVNPNALIAANAAGGTSGIIKKLVYKITAISTVTCTVANILYDNTHQIAVGDEFVRIGNSSDATRQGLLYLTSDDDKAPFMDVKAGIDTYAKWHTGNTKVRIGDLEGITETANEYGLWAGYSGSNYIKASTSGVEIHADDNTYTKYTGSTIEFIDDGNKKMDLTLGNISMYADNGSTVMAQWDNTTLSLGGDVSDTSYACRIDPTAVTIYGADANNYSTFTSSGLSVATGGNTKLTAADAGVTLYGDNSTTHLSIASTGLTIVDDGVTAAVFVANGCRFNGAGDDDNMIIGAAGMTVTTGGVLRLKALDEGVTIYGDDSNTRAEMTSAGMTIFNDDAVADPETGVAHYGTTARIGAFANEHIKITSSSMEMKDGSTVMMSLAAGTISLSGQVRIGKATGVYGEDDTNISIGDDNSGLGEQNINIGYQAGKVLTASSPACQTNICIGWKAGLIMGSAGGSTCISNVLVGGQTGATLTEGAYNVCIGDNADVSGTNSQNEIIIGYGADGGGSNIAVIGNQSLAHLYAAEDKTAKVWCNGIDSSSDARIKKNINTTTLGLDFINTLNPVTFNMRKVDEWDEDLLEKQSWVINAKRWAEKGKTPRDIDDTEFKIGFIAQEVKEALGDIDCDIHAVDENDCIEALDYSKFVVPLTKAVQELSAKMHTMQEEINTLKQG